MMKKLLLSLLLCTSVNLSAQTNNYSLEFDGSDDYVALGTSPMLGSFNSCTFMVWLKAYDDVTGPYNWRYPFSIGTGTTLHHAIQIKEDEQIKFSIAYSGAPDDLWSGQSMSLNQWTFIACVYDGNNRYISMAI